MNKACLKLIEPTIDLKAEFLEMAAEYEAIGEAEFNGIGSIVLDDFENSVRSVNDHSRGINVPDGWVPANTYWLIEKERILGSSSLRHELNDFLKNIGGHIGYSIRPSQRGKGYGKVILRLTLEKAHRLALKKILVTCDDDNIASARVIERNSGVLQDKILNEGHTVLTRRYWINLTENKE